MSDCKILLHGTLIDGNGGTPIEDSAIVIMGTHIAWVGPAGALPCYDNATVLDATGKYLIPGLIEGHAGISGYGAISTLQESVKWGITTVASVSAGENGVLLRDAIKSQRIRNCAKLLVGGAICSTGGHLKVNIADGPWEIRREVRRYAEMEVDFIKTAASLGVWDKNEKCHARNYTLEELGALADEARAWDLKSIVHVHMDPGLTNAITSGIDQIHHGQWISSVHIQAMKCKDLYYMPILKITSHRNYSTWDSRPWMKKRLEAAHHGHREGVRQAKLAGVKIMVGSIYPGPADRWTCGEGTSFEMTELQACGLSPMDILVAATRNNAEGYGKLEEIGTIEAGKQADIVLVSKNPLEDISVLHEQSNIELVFCDGQEVYKR